MMMKKGIVAWLERVLPVRKRVEVDETPVRCSGATLWRVCTRLNQPKVLEEDEQVERCVT